MNMFKNLKEDLMNNVNTHTQLNEKIQDMNIEFNKDIELLKKSPTEMKLKMKNSGSQTKDSGKSLTNKFN